LPQAEAIGVRLAMALEELGGLYLAFGVFLQWRSDLLSSGLIEALSTLKVHPEGYSRQQVTAIVQTRLGSSGEKIAATLSEQPAWNTLNRTAYRARFDDLPIIVEVAAPPHAPQELQTFLRGILALGAPELIHLCQPGVLNQFVEWLRAGESVTEERNFLEAIHQFGGQTNAIYPVPVTHLCAPEFLVWKAIEGKPVHDLIAKGDPNVCTLIASAVFEQFCALGMVDCDLRQDAMVVTPQNRLGILRIGRPGATPPGMTAAALEYIAAAIAREAALSSRALLRLAISYESPVLEKELVHHLSAVDPELKVQRWFPPSAETFEANWRAITRLGGVNRSLFLDAFHRNVIAIGYWISDTVRAGAPMQDGIAEAQWPVVGRMLRERVSQVMNTQTATEWAASSGLLMLGLMKEASRLAAEVRDNRLSMGFDLTSTRDTTETTRPAWLLPLGLVLLSIFLICLRWGNMAPPILILPVQALTIATLIGLFWVVLRIR
jgi:hypothetical protein